MAKYTYQAYDESGQEQSGTIEADSTEGAENLLAAKGYIPIRISSESVVSNSLIEKINDLLTPVSAPDLLLFTKQFRSMLVAGVPILNLLEVLEVQTENRKLKKTVGALMQSVQEGSTLHEAFRKHPGVFSPLYYSIVRAGETSGALPDVLDRLGYIIEHEHKVRSDIRSALQYPIMVVIALVIAFFVLLTFVIPKFVEIFKRSGIDLPLPTRICMVLYQFLAHQWPILIVALIAVIAGLSWYLKTEAGQYTKDSLMLRLPVIGKLMVKTAMSRFASIFSILQASGVPVLESLRILSGTIGNRAIAEEFKKVRERVEEGRGIASPLRTARYFTPMVINMVAIGEESGNLDEMLMEVSRHYDYEVEYAVKRLSETLSPILIVGLAAVVGFFALAIFLPMWDLTQIAKKGF